MKTMAGPKSKSPPNFQMAKRVFISLMKAPAMSPISAAIIAPSASTRISARGEPPKLVLIARVSTPINVARTAPMMPLAMKISPTVAGVI
ncbi:hypothetical protein ES708_13914 [subsurface metagenome]